MTKPEMPTTSSTLTVIARYPSGITAGRPPPAPSGASFMLVTVSRTPIGVIATRPATSSIFLKAPTGVEPFGICASVNCSRVILVPRGISCLATTTLPRSLVNASTCDRYRVTSITPINPQMTAPARAMMKRLFRITYSPFVTETKYLTRHLSAKHKHRHQRATTNWNGVGESVAAICGHFKMWHRLARQQATEKLQHPNHSASDAARVEHLADSQDTTHDCYDQQCLQYMGYADDRPYSSKQLYISRSHRAECVQNEHQSKRDCESAKA